MFFKRLVICHSERLTWATNSAQILLLLHVPVCITPITAHFSVYYPSYCTFQRTLLLLLHMYITSGTAQNYSSRVQLLSETGFSVQRGTAVSPEHAAGSGDNAQDARVTARPRGFGSVSASAHASTATTRGSGPTATASPYRQDYTSHERPPEALALVNLSHATAAGPGAGDMITNICM